MSDEIIDEVIELINQDIVIQERMIKKNPRYSSQCDWRIVGMEYLKKNVMKLKGGIDGRR